MPRLIKVEAEKPSPASSILESKQHLRKWKDIPPWQQSTSGSYRKSFLSLGYIHNETVNIYSHIIGALIFLILPVFTYIRYPTATRADVLVFSTFFYGVAICFILSTTYHLIGNHSLHVSRFAIQLDYLGIVILRLGSTIPSVYYGFYCNPNIQKAYMTNAFATATFAIIATFQPRFHHPTVRSYRVTVYGGLGLLANIFVIHGVLLHGWAEQNQRMSIDYMGLMALLTIIGGVIYVARIPEKWQPMKFDIYGNSHQILHVAVIFAALAHFRGLIKAFEYLHTGGGDSCTVPAV